MQSFLVTKNEAGQRLDKLLAKYMDTAPKSFFYKMLRKKNITLNGKKCEGAERLNVGDVVKLFLSDETIDQFREAIASPPTKNTKNPSPTGNYPKPEQVRLTIVYEDKDIILINKPAGMLSQKAVPSDISLNEYLIHYLLTNKKITEKQLELF